MQVLTPIDDLNDEISWIDIDITLGSVLIQDDFYEGAMTPGEEYDLFASNDTTITDNGIFSAYYSLYISDFSNSKYYTDYTTYNRVLVSRDSNNNGYALPANTKIVMLDMVTKEYYYYIVTASDESSGKYEYNLSNFIALGSTNKNYDENAACSEYYITTSNAVYENFIFHVDFSDSSISENIEENTLLMEMRDSGNQRLIEVLGMERDYMKYNVYCNNDAQIKLSGKLSENTIYLGKKVGLDVEAIFTQSVVSSKTVFDTQYFDDKLGLKIGIYDNNGTLLSSSSLLGIYFELNGTKYYPRYDGTIRMCIAEKVTDVLAKLTIHTEANTTLATGDYTIKIDSFGSPDGIYYGLEPSDTLSLKLTVINSSYGLKVTTSDQEKIVDRKTGKSDNGSNNYNVTLGYSSSLEKPKITVSLYRRDYSDYYAQDYELVDLADYFSNELTPAENDKEYIVSNEPVNNINYFYTTKENLPMTGTYKLVYKLYNGSTYIGEDYEYIVIK